MEVRRWGAARIRVLSLVSPRPSCMEVLWFPVMWRHVVWGAGPGFFT